MRIYLDVCCYNRPFDDQGQDRVRLEAEAVVTVLRRADLREWEVVASTFVELEVMAIPDPDRKFVVMQLLPPRERCMLVGQEQRDRARELAALGFKPEDALHVACAESLRADVLLTTDDRLVRAAEKHRRRVKVKVANPLAWIEERV